MANLWNLGLVLPVGGWPLAEMLQFRSMEKAAMQGTLSGGQVVVAIAAGLVMAIAFQFLLTNLGVALGLTIASFRPKPLKPSEAPSSKPDGDRNEASQGILLQAVGIATGLSVLLTVSGVLAVASFLAVTLSAPTEPMVGGILGILIWAAYVLLLTWLSSVAVGSVVDTALSSVTAGFGMLLRAVRSALPGGQSDTNPLSQQEVLRAVQQEVDAALRAVDVQSEVQDYLAAIAPSPQTHLKQQLLEVLHHPDVASTGVRPNRDGLMALVQTAGATLTAHEQARLVDELLDALQTANAEPASAQPLANEVEGQSPQANHIANAHIPTASLTVHPEVEAPQSASPLVALLEKPLAMLPTSLSDRLQSLLERVDAQQLLLLAMRQAEITEWDLERLWHWVRSHASEWVPSSNANGGSANGQTSLPGQSTEPFSIVRLDVEDYLRRSHLWELDEALLAEDLPGVLCDPEADPARVLEEVSHLSEQDFIEMLRQRNDLEPERIAAIAQRLEAIRAAVERSLQVAVASSPLVQTHDRNGSSASGSPDESPEMQMAIATLYAKLESYLRYTNLSKLTLPKVQQKVQALMAELPRSKVLPPFDRERLYERLQQRKRRKSKNKGKGLKTKHINALLDAMEQTWNEQAQQVAPMQNLEPSSEPDGQQWMAIAAGSLVTQLKTRDWQSMPLSELQALARQIVEQPQMAVRTVGRHVAQLDWSPVIRELQALMLTDDQIKPILAGLQHGLYTMARLPRRWLRRTAHSPRLLSHQLRRYLTHQSKSRLTADSVWQDLQAIANGLPGLDANAIAQLKTQLGASEVTQWLTARADLSPDEIAAIAQNVQTWMHTQSIPEPSSSLHEATQSTLEDWLHLAQRQLQHLSPDGAIDWSQDGLQTKVTEILAAPAAHLDGLKQSLGELLQQTPGHLLGAIALNPVVWPQQLQEVISLEPVRDRIMHTSEAIVEAMTQRGQDVSEAVMQSVVQQVEATRDRLLAQVEQVQTELQTQADAALRHMQTQADNARKIAAIAAWWLFSTALVAGIMSAIAGTWAVTGVPSLPSLPAFPIPTQTSPISTDPISTDPSPNEPHSSTTAPPTYLPSW
ncbi:hypothetical protein ACQ4M4_28205 [Leptolyngbya sp. AN02str]|uniref:hypothetical protein n=1 Tax=Leptolyngbya sp. AN02str TaxID=3423363 RepID=UPI003D31A839